jgi:hypothetical protein
MARPGTENYIVRRPDYIPAEDEHLYPHLGGTFHDYVPEGKQALTMHGLTDDADQPEAEDGFAEAKRLASEKAKK